MVKMFIQMDEEKYSFEKLQEVNSFIDNVFKRVDGYKDKYGCYTNGRFETFGAAYCYLERIEGFLDNVKIALWFKDDGHEGDFSWEDCLAKELGKSLVLMRFRFCDEKLEYAGTTADEFLEKYTDFCETYDISRPMECMYAASGKNAVVLMEMMIEDMMRSEFFMYAVYDWYLYIDGKVENLLTRALEWRKQEGISQKWPELSKNKIFTINSI